MASLAGLAPGGSSIAYAASKAALIHLTYCLAVALAPDATVNCIAPGLVEGTRMAERVPQAMKELAHAQRRAHNPLQVREQVAAPRSTETSAMRHMGSAD
jgi:NAD(P)-dependent dehydrogenase (short-subunit alcohol dehydrogenase family)